MNKTQCKKIQAKVQKLYGLVYQISIQENTNPVFLNYASHTCNLNCYQYRNINNVDQGRNFGLDFYIYGNLTNGFEATIKNLTDLENRLITILNK